MIANIDCHGFDVVEITNEMPLNRIGGVGSVIEGLLSGFQALGTSTLWFLVDHFYRDFEQEEILSRFPSVAIGEYADLKRFEAPVTHLHSYNYNPKLVDHLAGTHSVFTVHSLLAYEEISNDVDLSDMVRGQEDLIRACDEVVLVSEAERRYYRELGYERLNPRVSVVYNGVRPPCGFRSLRGRKTLGYCGRLVPRKHPEYVQMMLLESGFEEATAMIAGKAFSRYARDLVRDLGIEERVRYLGWCGGERLEAFYDAIDVLAIPSTYEPFGLTALEAALRGVPVVCTAVDGLIEVLGEHAFYCEDTGYPSFRDAMYRWHDASDQTVAALTDGARNRCLELFTDRVMAEKYVQRFAELTGPDAGTLPPNAKGS